jgi:Protein of unknown function (DUF1761)
MQIPVNYLAVIIATLAAFGLGMVWHTVLFRPWRASLGKTADVDGRTYVVPFLITFLALLLTAWMLAGLMGHLAQVNPRGGAMTAFFVWAGFVITVMAVSHAFTGAKPMLMVIDGAYWLLALLIMGAVIGAFGMPGT